MGGEPDVAKNRIKGAAGMLARNVKLYDEGKTGQILGKARPSAQMVADMAKQGVKEVLDCPKATNPIAAPSVRITIRHDAD